MRTIKEILIDRDGMSAEEADEMIRDAKADLEDRLGDPDTYGDPYEVCADHFGIEPDYLMELVDL